MAKRVQNRVARLERALAGFAIILFGVALIATGLAGPAVGLALMVGVVLVLAGACLHLASDRKYAAAETDAFEQHIRQQLHEDPETGLGTARQLDVAWIKSTARARRWNEPFCITILEVAEALGSIDRVDARTASAMAGIITTLARGEDSVFRLGDSTFAVLLAGAEMSGASMFMERARIRISSDPIPDASGRFYTVYGGVVQWREGFRGATEMVGEAQTDMHRYGSELRRQAATWGAPAV